MMGLPMAQHLMRLMAVQSVKFALSKLPNKAAVSAAFLQMEYILWITKSGR
jgi:hypothetical protein